MRNFLDPARSVTAFLLPFLGLGTAFGQPGQVIEAGGAHARRGTTAVVRSAADLGARARDEAELARAVRWAAAGMNVTQADRRLFQVQVGAATSGFVSLTPLSDAPTTLIASGTGFLARLFVPATGLMELYLIYVPPTSPMIERPLLAAFHSFGSSHLGIATFTTYLREAEMRDWFLVAPIQSGGPGFTQVSYGSIQSQQHVEAVMALLLDTYTIDLDRIYGVGFSMGGGNVMSYATRHRDRRQGAFAAVVNHTGTVALADTYDFVATSVRPIMETLFFGTPIEAPFEWTRASSIVLDGASQLAVNADHMAINLTNVPIKTIYGLGDPNQYLIDQSIQLDTFFQSVGGVNHTLEPTIEMPECVIKGGHCWDTADEVLVCDWLGTHTLDSNPMSGTILTDRSARSGLYDLELDVPDTFGGFEFEVEPMLKSIAFRGVRNLSEVAVDPSQVGLDLTGSFTVEISSEELGGDDYRMRNYPAAPTLIERDGLSVLEDSVAAPGDPSWSYDSATGNLVLHELGGPVPAVWTIFP